MRMPEQAPAADAAAVPVFPIREVTRATGVAPVTLRAWERRYGLLRPRRTPKGHRLYAPGDIARVHRILGLVERGVPVGQVRGVLDGPRAERADAPVPAVGAECGALRAALVEAARRLAAPVFDQALRRGLTELPLDVCYRRVLEPARAQLRCTEGRGEPAAAAAGVFFDARAALYLAARLGQYRAQRQAKAAAVWLQGVPGECDAVGVLIHAYACAEAGLEPLAITLPLSAPALAAVAAAGAVAAIVLVGQGTVPDAASGRALAQTARTQALPCLLAGPAAVLAQDAFAELGFEALPPAPAAAAAVIAQRIRIRAAGGAGAHG